MILKRAKRGHWDKGEKIPYRETAITERLRTEVREVNAWLERADIAFDPSAHDRPSMYRRVRLYRYFAARLQKRRKALQRVLAKLAETGAPYSALRIQGERVVGT